MTLSLDGRRLYLAVAARGSVLWTAVAMAGGVLSKENAVVAPVLIVAAWAAGLAPWPTRSRVTAFAVTWAVYQLGMSSRADSLLARADSACPHCPTMYRNQAGAARIRGDTAAARLLLVHAERVALPAH